MYSKLRDLYIVTRQYDDAIVYGREAVSTEQSHMSPNDDRYYFPYMLMAEVYRLKGDKENCFNCIDSLFMGLNRIKEPKELSQMYMARARCYHEFNDYEKALSDYKKADEILAEKFLLPDDDRVQLLALIGGWNINWDIMQNPSIITDYMPIMSNTYLVKKVWNISMR